MLISGLVNTIVENCMIRVSLLTHRELCQLTCVLRPDLIVECTLYPDIAECHYWVEGLLVGLTELGHVLMRKLWHMLFHELSF